MALTPGLLLDTHAAIWYAAADIRLSAKVSDRITAHIQAGHRVAISAITLVEIVYLVERNRIAVEVQATITDMIASGSLQVLALDAAAAQAVAQVNRAQVPDMPDRVIVATALIHGLELASRDGKIAAYYPYSIW